MSVERARELMPAQGPSAEQDLQHDAVAPTDHQMLLRASLADIRAYRGGVGGSPSAGPALNAGIAAPLVELPHRAEMERSAGRPLDDVRVHGGPQAAAATAAIGAEAFTYGNDVVLGSQTPSREVVAHELTHVRQQQAGRASSESSDEAEASAAERTGLAAAPAHDVGPARSELRFKKPHDLAESDLESLAIADNADAATLLSASKIKKAIKHNNAAWTGEHRTEILAYLRGSGGGDADFTESDVQKVAELQLGAGVKPKEVDGEIGNVTMSILLNAGLVLSAPSKKVNKKDVELVFFPGELEDKGAWEAAKKSATDHKDEYDDITDRGQPDGTGKFYVKHHGQIVAVLDVRGGPPIKLTAGQGHTADPSAAGQYKLAKGKPHRSDTWYYSQIEWGAQIRERSDGEIEFLDPDATKWQVATGSESKLKQRMDKSDFMIDPDDASKGYKTEWRENDFGPISWQLKGTKMFIHTTPEDEEDVVNQVGPRLECSHACLHVVPTQRDEMAKAGYFQEGVKITIKKYSAHLLPQDMRDEMIQ